MRRYVIRPHLVEILKKIAKKDPVMYGRILKKIDEIINSVDVEHYKNLMGSMKALKRVHIGHFVLVFRIESEMIVFEDFDHHDNIYK